MIVSDSDSDPALPSQRRVSGWGVVLQLFENESGPGSARRARQSPACTKAQLSDLLAMKLLPHGAQASPGPGGSVAAESWSRPGQPHCARAGQGRQHGAIQTEFKPRDSNSSCRVF